MTSGTESLLGRTSLLATCDRIRHAIPFWWWLTYDALVGVVIAVGVSPSDPAFWLGMGVLFIAVVIDVAEFIAKRPGRLQPLDTAGILWVAAIDQVLSGTRIGRAVLVSVNVDDPHDGGAMWEGPFEERESDTREAHPIARALALWESIKDDFPTHTATVIANDRAKNLAAAHRMARMGFDYAESLASYESEGGISLVAKISALRRRAQNNNLGGVRDARGKE